jgi:hypothetical protein
VSPDPAPGPGPGPDPGQDAGADSAEPAHCVPLVRRPGRWDVPPEPPWHRPRPAAVLWNLGPVAQVVLLGVVVVGEWDALLVVSVAVVVNAVVSAAREPAPGAGDVPGASARPGRSSSWLRRVVLGWPVLVVVTAVVLVAVQPASAGVRYPAALVSAVARAVWGAVLVRRRRRGVPRDSSAGGPQGP